MHINQYNTLVSTLTLLFLSFLPLKTEGQSYDEKISVKALHQLYQKGSLMNITAELMYDGQTQKVISHYISPEEFFKSINQKGEITIYRPDENTVTFTQNNHYSSSNELLYYFVNNKTENLGLKNEGFTRVNTKRDGQHLITTWQAPPGMNKVSTVELVSKNFRPIFARYIDYSGKTLKKIYYYDYYSGPQFSLPKKITEITYKALGDSTVRRTTYSDIKTGKQVKAEKFDFNIPDNAQKIDF